MMFGQRGISPGPTWAVLSNPASSSSPTTQTSLQYSDVDIDLNDVDMGDDEAEHESEPGGRRPPISKRKAPTDGVSLATRKPHKAPRLDLGGAANGSGSINAGSASASGSRLPPSSSSPSSGAARLRHAAPSLTQSASAQQKQKQPLFSTRAGPSRTQVSRAESPDANGGASTSDVSRTLSQPVRRLPGREKEKEKSGRVESGRGEAMTARKHTMPPKNNRKVTTGNLLKQAQTSIPRDESRAWTRRPKLKQKRTNIDIETAYSRPLQTVRQRVADIELTDSTDSTPFRPTQSVSKARTDRRPSASATMDDPIVLTSGSEDNNVSMTQRSKRGTQGRANRPRAPPPADVEVISLSDSDDAAAPPPNQGANREVLPSRSSVQEAPPLSRPKTTPMLVPPSVPERAAVPATTPATAVSIPNGTPTSTRPRLPDPSSSPPPSYDPHPDDLDHSFDFDAGGDDRNQNGPWDELDIAPSLATLPVSVSSGSTANHGGDVDTSVAERIEDLMGQDALFDSYVNTDQLGGELDQAGVGDNATSSGRKSGTEGARTVESVVTGGVDASMCADLQRKDGTNVGDGDCVHTQLEEGEVLPGQMAQRCMRTDLQSKDGANVGGDDDDMRMQLEEGEVLPGEVASRSMPTPGTPESGEIEESQREASGDGKGASLIVRPSTSQPVVANLAPTPAVPQFVLSDLMLLAEPSTGPHSTASQSLGRARTLVMPDISSYKGIRFKRPLGPEAGENSFFSRALNGITRFTVKQPVGGEERQKKSASDSASVFAEASSHHNEARDHDEDMHMQDDIAASMTSKAVVPTPLPLQPPTESMVANTPSASLTTQIRFSTTTTENEDLLPPSSQLGVSSIKATPIERPPATQPISSSSARPFIAPPRVPRPSVPMSLVDVLNEVRQDQLQVVKEKQELAQQRNMADHAAERASLAQRNQGDKEMHTPIRPGSSQSYVQRQTQSPTPSLNNIRALLAKRIASASQPARLTTTPDDVADRYATARVPSRSVGGKDSSQSSSPVAGSSSSASSRGPRARRQTVSLLPFEAFISPVRSQPQSHENGEDRGKGKGKESISASTFWSRSQRPKAKNGASQQARRMSASAAFEAYIVRNTPRKTDGLRVGRDAGTEKEVDNVRPPPPLFSETGGAPLPSSSVVPEVIPTSVAVVGATSGIGVEKDGHAKDTHAMNVTPEVDAMEVDESRVDAAGMDYSERVDEETVSGEVDEADSLLELASVHLSWQDTDAVEEAAPVNKLTTQGLASHGMSAKVPGANMQEEPLPNENIVNTNTEHDTPYADPVKTPSRSTTPDLILPEEDDIEPICASADPEDVSRCYAPQRRSTGGADSTDECAALLIVPGRCDSEPEAVPSRSAVSSRTASSTPLSLPRKVGRPKKRKSASRAASTADQSGRAQHPTPTSNRPKDVHKKIGGRPAITWASYVADVRRRPPKYKKGRDIPHSLQDHMNAQPASFRNSEMARKIFEAHIRESMVIEPNTPAIEVFDNDIGEEATPPWEFHYTNEIWYGDGVPPPDIKGLEGCGCVGRCNPKSGTCACAQRQLRWVQQYIDAELIPRTWPGSPFVYDQRGILQRLESPIFECNQFCSCDEDCPNRVVQNGRKWPVHIARTAHKGWGVVAGNKKIPKGSFIGIYAGELLTEQEGEARGRYYDLYGRTYLFSIDFHHLKFGLENPEEWDNLYVVDAYHAGNFTRFLNHSCDPNCKIFACYTDDADIDKPLLAVFTIRDVEPWEELCFSYYGDIEEKREEIEAARAQFGSEDVRAHAVYAQCRCEADNCIGRLFG